MADALEAHGMNHKLGTTRIYSNGNTVMMAPNADSTNSIYKKSVAKKMGHTQNHLPRVNSRGL